MMNYKYNSLAISLIWIIRAGQLFESANYPNRKIIQARELFKLANIRIGKLFKKLE